MVVTSDIDNGVEWTDIYVHMWSSFWMFREGSEIVRGSVDTTTNRY